MKNAIAILLGLLSYQLVAQCETTEVTFDYCHTEEAFDSYWAGFIDGEATFKLFAGKKKVRDINISTSSGYGYLLGLVANKKLKISAKDILFIEAAINSWVVESRKFGYEVDDSGLGIKKISEGTGDFPQKGEKVVVHYTGWLLNGKKFDSSLDRGRPYSFILGQGRVIKGWDQGVAKLRVGTKALLKIPPDLGYGSRGAGSNIPPGSTLIFEIALLGSGE